MINKQKARLDHPCTHNGACSFYIIAKLLIILSLSLSCIDKKDRDGRMTTPPPPDTTDTK